MRPSGALLGRLPTYPFGQDTCPVGESAYPKYNRPRRDLSGRRGGLASSGSYPGSAGTPSVEAGQRTRRRAGCNRLGAMMSSGWFETVAEAQRRAKKRIPKSVYMALLAGSEKGVSYRDNTAAF